MLFSYADVDTVRRAVQDMGKYRRPDFDPSMMTPHEAALEAAKPPYTEFRLENYMPASGLGDSFLSMLQSIMPYTPYGLVSDWFHQPSLSEAANSIDPRTVGKQPVQLDAVYPAPIPGRWSTADDYGMIEDTPPVSVVPYFL